ncbi:MAG: hypothetical protein MOP51_909, partial [Citricoccus sp.]|nr:hypothetical protein [Citricoccus sp. WCRC_4]
MEHALRLDLRAEVLPGPIQLVAEGCLTEASCQVLLKVLDGAFTLVGCPCVIVNLSGLGHLDRGGLRALEDHVAIRAHNRTPPARVLPLCSAPRRNGPRPMGERDDRPVTGSGAVCVGEPMSPSGPTVGATDVVGEAARVLQAHGETVVMMDTAKPWGSCILRPFSSNAPSTCRWCCPPVSAPPIRRPGHGRLNRLT